MQVRAVRRASAAMVWAAVFVTASTGCDKVKEGVSGDLDLDRDLEGIDINELIDALDLDRGDQPPADQDAADNPADNPTDNPGDDPADVPDEGDAGDTPADADGTDQPTDNPTDNPVDTADDTPADNPVDNPTDGIDLPDLDVTPAGCGLVEGLNRLTVDGRQREFYIDLPQGATAGTGYPVVFNWHGYGDTAANMRGLVQNLTDFDPAFKFIGVTPEDLNLQIPSGVDWDNLNVQDGATNQEARLFDEVLRCIEGQWGVDENRVHTMGFSAGGIMSDLLGVIRGDRIASILTFSGGYFSTPENAQALSGFARWPAPVSTNRYAQLIAYGGTTDTFNAFILTVDFPKMGRADTAVLNAAGHDLVVCEHGGGHTVPGELQGAPIVRFFKAHPKGAPSPWRGGLPGEAGLPSYCRVSAASAGSR